MCFLKAEPGVGEFLGRLCGSIISDDAQPVQHGRKQCALEAQKGIRLVVMRDGIILADVHIQRPCDRVPHGGERIREDAYARNARILPVGPIHPNDWSGLDHMPLALVRYDHNRLEACKQHRNIAGGVRR